MDASLLLQLLANGVSIGLGYGLAAVGLALVFGILEQVNFAHGEVYMVGAFALWFLSQREGLPYALAFPLMVALMAGFGLLMDEVVFLPTLLYGTLLLLIVLFMPQGMARWFGRPATSDS